MSARILVTICVLIYAVLVPVLEINATHVFNPAWVPHARLHEVWQLITNSALGLLCLWLTWSRREVRLPSALAIIITGAFLLAYVVREGYGGSMVHPDGSEKLLLGINAGVMAFGLVILLSTVALLLDRRAASPRQVRTGPTPFVPGK